VSHFIEVNLHNFLQYRGIFIINIKFIMLFEIETHIISAFFSVLFVYIRLTLSDIVSTLSFQFFQTSHSLLWLQTLFSLRTLILFTFCVCQFSICRFSSLVICSLRSSWLWLLVCGCGCDCGLCFVWCLLLVSLWFVDYAHARGLWFVQFVLTFCAHHRCSHLIINPLF